MKKSTETTLETTASPVATPATGLALFDLHVSATPLEIQFDAHALNVAIHSVIENYSDLVVTEDIIPAIKSEMAGLNKMRDRIEEARKEIVRKISAPVHAFEVQVKAAVQRITDARAALDTQVKAFEENDRRARMDGVKKIINDVLADAAMMDDFSVGIDTRWLNKTATTKSIRAEVETLVLREKTARLQKEQLERAKADRIALVEQNVSLVGKKFGFELSVSRFSRLFDLNIPLDEALSSIHAEFEKYRASLQGVTVPAQEPVMPIAVNVPAPEDDDAMPTAKDDKTRQNTTKDDMPTADAPVQSHQDQDADFIRSMQLSITCKARDFYAVMRLLKKYANSP